MKKLTFSALSPLVVLIAAALLFSAPAGASASASELQSGLEAFHGTWLRTGGAEDDGKRNSAIDRALAGLAWVTRTMAAPILRRSVKPPETVAFIVAPDAVKLVQQGRPARVLDFDGHESTMTGDDGKQYRQRTTLLGATAIQAQWTGEQAIGVNVYRLSADGAQLVIEHRIQVTQISGIEPIVFESRFTRAPAVAVSAR